MNIKDLHPSVLFLFVTIGQAAVSASHGGMRKKQFVEFCSEIWETMKLNGSEEFSVMLMELIKSDIDRRLGPGLGDIINDMGDRIKKEKR